MNTAAWKKQYQAMSDEQKELMEFTSHTVVELKSKRLARNNSKKYCLIIIKYNGKKDQLRVYYR